MSPPAPTVSHPALLLLGLAQRSGPDDCPGRPVTPAASTVSHPVNLLLGLAQTAGPTTESASEDSV